MLAGKRWCLARQTGNVVGNVFKPNMKHLICLAMMGALLVCGCSSPKQSFPPEMLTQGIADKRVLFSPSLGGTLQLLHVATPGGNGYLQAEITVKNLSPKYCRISYNVQWFDAQGQPLRLPMTVVPWTLLGSETSSLTITAASPLARDFQIEFVPAN
jgi:uncharacterized protein YcfL